MYFVALPDEYSQYLWLIVVDFQPLGILQGIERLYGIERDDTALWLCSHTRNAGADPFKVLEHNDLPGWRPRKVFHQLCKVGVRKVFVENLLVMARQVVQHNILREMRPTFAGRGRAGGDVMRTMLKCKRLLHQKVPLARCNRKM